MNRSEESASDRPRGTPKDPERARRLILAAALKSFATKGYRGTRVADVARSAGYSEATVFHHFGSKAELFRAVVAANDQGTAWFEPGADADALAAQLYASERRFHRNGQFRTLDRAWADALAGEGDLLDMLKPAMGGGVAAMERALAAIGGGDDAQRRLLARFISAVSFGSRVMRRYDEDVMSGDEAADLLRFAARVAAATLRGDGPGLEVTPGGNVTP